MSNYNQKNQKVNNQINADNVGQEIENSGEISQAINAKKVQIGTKPVTCPNCKTSNKISDRFCKKCGQSLTNLCLTCWTENDLSTVFCTSCGVEIKKSKFGIPPQLAQAWKEKFASLGWHTSVIRERTLAVLEKMGQPVDSQREIVILSAGIVHKSSICKVSVAGKEFRADFVHQDKYTGGLMLTSQRILVHNYVDGWIASYPHEYLNGISTRIGNSTGETYLGDETMIFSLNYNQLGEINFSKIVPKLYHRPFVERLTTSSSLNARLDMETTIINTALVQRIKDVHDENTVFVHFFQSIIELQQSFHQNKPGFKSSLSIEQVIQDVPEIKLPVDKDSCAPKAVAMLMLVFAFVSLLIHYWLF